MIQVPPEDAQYLKFRLKEEIDHLDKERAAADKRGHTNIVARKPEQYLSAALTRARSVLIDAYRGINPTKESNHEQVQDQAH